MYLIFFKKDLIYILSAIYRVDYALSLVFIYSVNIIKIRKIIIKIVI